jgi:hypothetical protein
MGFCSILVLITIILNVGLRQFSTLQEEIMRTYTRQQDTLIAHEMAFSILQVYHFWTEAALTHQQKSALQAEAAVSEVKKNIEQVREMKDISSGDIQKLDALEALFDAFVAQGRQMVSAYVAEGLEAGNIINADFEKNRSF